jgi:hypothetical protein
MVVEPVGDADAATSARLMTLFTEELHWLGREDLAWIMGKGSANG